MSIAANRVRLTVVTVSSVLAASCAAPTPGTTDAAHRRPTEPVPEFVTAGEDKPPMILPETYFSAGRLLESRGRYLDARAQYRKAVAVQHEYVDAYHRLGLVNSVLGEREDALKALTRAVELRPDDSILRNNLGFEYLLCERWVDAERELQTATRLDPGFARAHINLGIVQSRLQRFDQALLSFLVALPEPDAHYNLGLMYRGQERYQEASDAFERVLEIDPEFNAAWKQLRQVRAKLAHSPESETKEKAKFVPTSSPSRSSSGAQRNADDDFTSTRIADSASSDGAHHRERDGHAQAFDWDELAGEADLMTTDIRDLVALIDHRLHTASDQDDAQSWVAFEPDLESRQHHADWSEPDAWADEQSVDQWTPDEPAPDSHAAMYGEDMPFRVALPDRPDSSASSNVGEGDAWRAVPATLADGSNQSPAWDASTAEEECDEYLLIDRPDGRHAEFPTSWSDRPHQPQPSPSADDCPAETDTILAVLASSDFSHRAPALSPAPAAIRAPGPIASFDGSLVLAQLENELKQVREEIRCLEMMDQDAAQERLASDARSPSPAQRRSDHFASNDIPEPLRWMFDARSDAADSRNQWPTIDRSFQEIMGPPAPPVTRMPLPRASDTQATRMRLAASDTDPLPRSGNSARGYEVTEYEIREPADPAFVENLDEWSSIMMNELTCLEQSAQVAPVVPYGWHLEEAFDASFLPTWPYLDINDQIRLPGDGRMPGMRLDANRPAPASWNDRVRPFVRDRD